MTNADAIGGPAVPTACHAQYRGLGQTRLDGGLLAHWQRVNKTASVPLALRKLESEGNLDNLRMAAGEYIGEIRGPVYMDSDIHKMLETIGWELRRADDQPLRDFLERTADLIDRAQQADGYLNSHYQVARPGERYSRLSNSHETYTAGHLLQAAVATHRSLRDERLLRSACRLADHLVAEFLDRGRPDLDGHPGIETALVELYRVTAETRYLELAEAFVDRRGKGSVGYSSRGPAYFQDAEPVRDMPTMAGHAVRALYLEAGIIDVYLETGDTSLLWPSVRRWTDMVAAKTAITGGMGARQLAEVFGERYELPPDQAYNETCAAVAAIHWTWRLLLATGEARYADLIERILYNVFGASFSVDGSSFFKGNPLQRRADHAEAVGDPKVRDAWFWSACCPPNVTRLISSLEHYVATMTANAVQLQLYANATIPAELAGGRVLLGIETDYPWDGTVRVTIKETPTAPWTLALRVPPWSAETALSVAGEERVPTPTENGYVEIDRQWSRGETVLLRLDMAPRPAVPHPRIDAVRGCVSLERGPLVYCFEQVDQPEDIGPDDLALLPGGALDASAQEDLPGIGRTVTIRADAVATSPPEPTALPYYSARTGSDVSGRRVAAVAVPYFQWANRGDGVMRVWMPLASGPGSPVDRRRARGTML